MLEFWHGAALTGIGRKSWQYKITCTECAEIVILNHSTAARANQGAFPVRCDPCKKIAKKHASLADYHRYKEAKKAKLGVVYVIPANLPRLDSDATKLVQRLSKKPALLRRVLERAKPYIDAALREGIKPETSRILIEAAELVERGDVENRWTRENRADGLQVTSFTQYTSPIGAF